MKLFLCLGLACILALPSQAEPAQKGEKKSPTIGMGGGGNLPPLSRRRMWRGMAASGSRKLIQGTEGGLAWLSTHQKAGGFWDVKSPCEGHDACQVGAGQAQQNLGVTALALLAFLGNGHSPWPDDLYRDVVRTATDWIVSTQDLESGLFGDPTVDGHSTEHCLAIWALAEVAGLTGDEKLRARCRKGLDWLTERQGADGLWKANTAKTGQVDRTLSAMALHSFSISQYCGVEIDSAAVVRGGNALMKRLLAKRAQRKKLARKEADARRKAAAKEAKKRRKQKKRKSRKKKSSKKGKSSKSTEELPEPEPIGPNYPNMEDEQVFWVLHWSQQLLNGSENTVGGALPAEGRNSPLERTAAMFEGLARRNGGLSSKQEWQSLLDIYVVGRQRTDNNHKGSWDPQSPSKNPGHTWAPWGGRTFATAIAILNLQSAWRFPKSLHR